MALLNVQPTLAVHEADRPVPWEPRCVLPPLDQMFGREAQLQELQGRLQANGRTVLAICGSAGMVII